MRRTRGTDFKQFKIAETVLREIFSRDGRRLMKRYIKISADNVDFDLNKDPVTIKKPGGGTETVKSTATQLPDLNTNILTVVSQGPTIKN